MAKLTHNECAEKCGMHSKNLYVYIGRGKIDVLENGDIDDQDLKNKAFIEKYIRKAAVKAAKKGEAKEAVVASEGVSGNGKPKQSGGAANGKTGEGILAWEKLEKQKAQLVIKELEGKTLKLDLANRKLQGDFIPVEAVRFLLTQLSEADHLAWENELENALIEMAGRYGLTRDEAAEMKRGKVAVINRIREKALTQAKAGLKRVQAEVSIQRGRGEHD